MKIISIVGKKNTGKTSLTVRIIKELKNRGFKVASIKHSHHKLNMDKKNTDTWHHKEAGSETIIGIGKTSYLNICKEIDLERLLFITKILNPVDFVVIEGFKNYSYPKIATSKDVIDEYTIKQIDAFNLKDNELKKLVDEIELKTHDITNTLYANTCGINNAKTISKEILNGKITTNDIDQIDTYLSIDNKVIGLNKFVNNYLKETNLGIIKTLNLEQYNVKKLEKIQILIDKENTPKKIETKNNNIKLKINNQKIELNKFTKKLITNTILSMTKTLKTPITSIKILNLKIDNENVYLNINKNMIEINEFVKELFKNTTYGILKSLKIENKKIKTIEITIN